MKLILVTLCLVNSVVVFAQNYPAPNIKSLGKNIKDFTPIGWKVIDSSKGDLNKDGKEDFVIVLQKNDSVAYFDSQNEDTIKLIPRILLIAFRSNSNGLYRKIEQNNEFLIDDNFPVTNLLPYSAIEIKDGTLEVEFSYDYINANFYHYMYRFKYQSSQFELIAAEQNYTTRATFDYQRCSLNFATRKGTVTLGNDVKEEILFGKKEVFTIKKKPKFLKFLREPGSNFKVFEGVFL